MNDAQKRNGLIDDCVELVDKEVKGKSGLGGMVIKTGYKAVKGVKPGFVRQVVSKLFDEWATELDPIWEEAVLQGGNPDRHFISQKPRVAEALLKVTDKKSKEAKGVVASTYKKLRPTAKKHVEEAVPALAGLLQKHADVS